MTHFASELRQNPKTRLRSVLLRLHAGPTTGKRTTRARDPHRRPALAGAGERDASAAMVAATSTPASRSSTPTTPLPRASSASAGAAIPRAPPPFRKRGPHVLLGVGGGAGTAASLAIEAEQVEPSEKSSARGGESTSVWAREGSARTAGAGARRSCRHKLSGGGAAAAVNFTGGLSRPVASRKGKRGRTPALGLLMAMTKREESPTPSHARRVRGGACRTARSGPMWAHHRKRTTRARDPHRRPALAGAGERDASAAMVAATSTPASRSSTPTTPLPRASSASAGAASSRSTSLPQARAPRPPRRRWRRRDGREPSHRGGTGGAVGEEQREGRGEHECVGQGGERAHSGRRGETKLQAQAIRWRCSGGGEFHRRVESAGGEQEGEKRKNAGGLGF
ncbi:uncharacterized protein [Miscanthus floridulus]|uniref:uncharacterized protein n=1 Tax=Miscanthus floridulus TaxID=154761 RepID=UPI00345A3377